MPSISNSLSSLIYSAAATSVKNAKTDSAQDSISVSSTGSDSVSTTVQLSAAALKKTQEGIQAVNKKNSSFLDLKTESHRLLEQINLTTDAEVQKANQEVPDTDDPALIKRAKQATDFFQKTATNPFAGLPREQLTSIVYDESGAYTTNERLAALAEKENQDTAYWTPILMADAVSGNHRATYKAALDFYDKMSPLERASRNYPPDYVSSVTKLLEEKEAQHDSVVEDVPTVDIRTRINPEADALYQTTAAAQD